MIEIEKKYRLTAAQRDEVVRRLRDAGAECRGEEFEENTIYGGGVLNSVDLVLRLRRVGGKALLTYKERFPGSSAIRHQREEQTEIADPDAMNAIIGLLGFTRALVYEKTRQTWVCGATEVVIDELSFGLFMEIEGDEEAINAVERQLGIEGFTAEHLSYPELTAKNGKRMGDLIEARFV